VKVSCLRKRLHHSIHGKVKQNINLFIFEGKHTRQDCFVNVCNNEASILFGCNTNIVNVMDGGSVMYTTYPVSKNTKKGEKKEVLLRLQGV